MTPGQNTRVLLASRPEGAPTVANFRIENGPLPQPEDGQLLLRTVYLSLDPYMRSRMSAAKSYAAAMNRGRRDGRRHRLQGRGFASPRLSGR